MKEKNVNRNAESVSESEVAEQEIDVLANEPYIHNLEDKTEIAVKEKLEVGRIYSNWKDIFMIIGCGLLGQKALKGGKQKNNAKKYLLQYASFMAVEGKRALLCTEIYDVPRYDDKLQQDNRGKCGAYIDKMLPVFLTFLANKEETEWFTFVTDVAKIVGLVNSEYKKYDDSKMKKINPAFSPYMVNRFYFCCSQHLEREVYVLLDRMQNDYKVLEYKKNFRIVTQDGAHVSSEEEEKLIAEAEKQVLNEMNFKTKRSLMWKNRGKEYYKRVYEFINKKYNLNWIRYYRQIQIKHDKELAKMAAKIIVTSEMNIEELRDNLISQFADKIYNEMSRRYETQRKTADSKISMLENSNREAAEQKYECDEKCQELKDYVQLQLLRREDVIDMMAEISKEEMPFKECDSFLETQYELISLMIARPTCAVQEEEKVSA